MGGFVAGGPFWGIDFRRVEIAPNQGLDIFKEHFEFYRDRYVLIGGTASSLATHASTHLPCSLIRSTSRSSASPAGTLYWTHSLPT